MNADGKADLIATNFESSAVSVLLGTGAGSFGPATNFAVGIPPVTLVAEDINADGKLDIITGNGSASTVSVLLGTGTGSLGTPTSIAFDSYAYSVAVSDINGDGKVDLIIANSYPTSKISVLLGTGTGSFGAQTTFPVGDFPSSVAVADVNLDGKPDLVTANNGSSNVSVLLNQQVVPHGVNFSQTTFSVSGGPTSVAVEDLNGDGRSDIITANQSSHNVSVLLGMSAGSFGPATNFSVANYPRSVAVSDVNGDGKPDIITANSTSANVSVLLGTGTGNFGAASNFAVSENPYTIAVADVNLDGKPDIITANGNNANVSVLLNVPVADLTLLLHAQPSTLSGTSTVSLVADVFKLNAVPTSGPITIYITKDPLLSLTFDPASTLVGNRLVQNSGWSFDGQSNPSFYVLTTTQATSVGAKLSAGLTGQFTPGNTKGNLSISALVEGSGIGEDKVINNADAELIDYFNK